MWQVRLPPTKGPNDGPLIHQLRQLQGRAVRAPPATSDPANFAALECCPDARKSRTAACRGAIWPFGRESVPAISKEEFLPTQAHLVHVSCQL